MGINQLNKGSYLKSLRNDFSLFLLIFVCVFVIWFVFHGYTFADIIGRNDATSGFVWLLNEYKLKTLSELAYNPTVLGGYPMAGALGVMWPLYALLKTQLFAPYFVLNGLILFIQSSIAYLAFKYSDFFLPKREGNLLGRFPEIFFVTSITAFAPLLGWRIGYGHVNIMLGILMLMTVLYLLHSVIEEKVTTFDLFLIFIGSSIAINFPAFQTFAHIIYLLPVYLLLVDFPLRKLFDKRIYKLLLFLIGLLIINAPFAYGLYAYYLTGDTSRAESINIYSYAPLDLKSLISSVFWQNDYVLLSPNQFLWHELNYPIGLGLLGLAFIKGWKRSVVALITAVVIIGFVLNVPGLSSVIKSLPLLKHMRVPQRILIPVAFGMTLSSCIYLLNRLPSIRANLRVFGFLIASIVAVYLMTILIGTYYEVLLLLLILGFFFSIKKNNEVVSVCVLAAIGMLSVECFYAKFPAKLDFASANKDIENFSEKYRSTNPYERAFVGFNHPEFGNNTALALGISSLNGYFYATGRFSQLVQGLYGVPYNPLELNWRFNYQSPIAPILTNFYNIKRALVVEEGTLKILPTNLEHQGLIFPEKIIFTDSFDVKMKLLRKNWKVAIVEDKAKEALKGIGPCAGGSASSSYDVDSKSLVLETVQSHSCLLIVPTNYSDYLSVSSDGDDKRVRRLPVNHALLGIILPQGKKKIEIRGSLIPSKGT